MAPPKGKPQVKLNATLFAMAIEELMTGPTTAQTISEVTGMGLVTVWHLIRGLRSRGVVHVSSYESDTTGRRVVRVFALGQGKDAKRPTIPRNERERRNRLRRKAKELGMFSQLAAANDPQRKAA